MSEKKCFYRNTKKRGKGLQRPPTPSKKSNSNIKIKEHTQAAPVKKRRTYRISTYISDSSGDVLEDTIQKIRKDTGRKPKIAKVIEMAIEKLNSE